MSVDQLYDRIRELEALLDECEKALKRYIDSCEICVPARHTCSRCEEAYNTLAKLRGEKE